MLRAVMKTVRARLALLAALGPLAACTPPAPPVDLLRAGLPVPPYALLGLGIQSDAAEGMLDDCLPC